MLVYNNMGVALQDQGKLDEALAALNKALSIKPDYAETYWNLAGIAENISEAKNWVGKCLEVKPNHLKAKLTLCALKFLKVISLIITHYGNRHIKIILSLVLSLGSLVYQYLRCTFIVGII